MCSPLCMEVAKESAQKIDRRSFLKTALGGGAAAAALASCSVGASVSFGNKAALKSQKKVVDLTHALSPRFPTYGGDVQFKLDTLATRDKDGYNVKKWDLAEHTGTHIDAPFHFHSNGIAVDQLDISTLFAPLAVIDISDKADKSADSVLTPEDITAWEKKYGSLPDGCCVAMHSGWSARAVSAAAFRNPDSKGAMHFPGFHGDTAEFLLKERNVAGVASDTLSIDHGASTDFKFHTLWLGGGRWGIECIANLGAVPPSGANVFVGAPKVEGGTGGPTRVLALV